MIELTPIREYEQAVYVYWLGPDLPTVKIGHTNNPSRRLEEFRRETGTPGHKASFAAIVWLDRHRERVELTVHRAAHKFRRDGEWFSMSASDAIDHVVAAAKANGIRYEVEDCAGVWAETIAQRKREAAEAETRRLEAEAEGKERLLRIFTFGGVAGALANAIMHGTGQYVMSDSNSFNEYVNGIVIRIDKNVTPKLTLNQAAVQRILEYFISHQEAFVMAVDEYSKRKPLKISTQGNDALIKYIGARAATHTGSPFQLALDAVLAVDRDEARRRQIHRDCAFDVCIYVAIAIKDGDSQFWKNKVTDPEAFRRFAYSASKPSESLGDLPVNENLIECFHTNHDAFVLAVAEGAKRPKVTVTEAQYLRDVRSKAEAREGNIIFANPDISFGTSLFPLAMRIIAAGDKAVLECPRPFWARVWG